MNYIPTHLPEYEIVQDAIFDWQEHFSFYRFFAGEHDPDKGEGFYYRIVFNPMLKEYCSQVISYYRIQRFPYHVNDYHPFFVYFSNGRITRLLYDPGHHHSAYAHLGAGKQALTIEYPWHSFCSGRKLFAIPLKPNYLNSLDLVLVDWWMQPGMPQFKLRSKIVDPWNPGLFPKNTQERGSFRDEVICPNCSKIYYFDEMNLENGVFQLPVECCSKTFIASYDPTKMKMEIV